MDKASLGPKLSLGLLAHNEQGRIDKALQSLFAQDVFQLYDVEVIIVANGCSDDTAAVARRAVAEFYPSSKARGSARVEEIVAAGKTNAWNQFVHRLSTPEASLLILMDADIWFLNNNTISSMVATLQGNPQAVVCVDRAVKDIELKQKRSLFENLLNSATPRIGPDRVPLCGQLYCVRSAEARLIRVPKEVTVDDGFLRALLLTRGFTVTEDSRRIVLDSTVGHGFASVTTIQELFKHEKWLITGSIINMLLFRRFESQVGPDRSAMRLMEQWEKEDPEWLPRYIASQVQAKGWRLLPREYWTRRWSRLKGLPIGSLVRRLPIAAIAAAVDALVFISAIADVRVGRAYRYWGRNMRTTNGRAMPPHGSHS